MNFVFVVLQCKANAFCGIAHVGNRASRLEPSRDQDPSVIGSVWMESVKRTRESVKRTREHVSTLTFKLV